MYEINILLWPAQRLDSNLFENVWCIIKSDIRGKIFNSKQGLFNEIKNIRNNSDTNITKKLVSLMHKRLF